jgi:cell division protein FtsX
MIVCTDSKKLSPQLLSQLHHDGYEIEGNAADQLRMQTLLYGICTAIIAIGLIVSLLSFLLLVTSIMIVVEKNRQKIENLSLIGYGRQSIALTYQLLAAAFDCITWFMGALLSTAFYPLFSSLLHAVVPTFMPMSILSAWLPAIILATAFTLLHALIVRHLVDRVVK